MNRNFARLFALIAAFVLVAVATRPAHARFRPGDPEYDDMIAFQKQQQALIDANAHGRTTKPMANPDIFGPGAVLNVGNVWMKITNNGFCGNPFTNISSDPSGQWPGASAVEYLNFLGLAVGAVNPQASDPTAVRRVSYALEWRPPTLDAEDRMYRSYDGIVNGARFVNDDGDFDPLTGDARLDEDFLDGRDNDGDGKIDEDFGAIGQQMYTCVMSDNTPQAINLVQTERHVPLGVEVQQSAWAYSIPGYQNFNVIQYDIYNRSGHMLDSVVVGWIVDLDCGPIDKGNYFSDDFSLNHYPYGDFIIQTTSTDLRLQPGSDRAHISGVADDAPLCPQYKVRVQGFSIADDDGDDAKTTGIGSFWLINHTIDPTGVNGPARVGFKAFRSWQGSLPYQQGGPPRLDQQRFEFMTGNGPGDTKTGVTANIDNETGFIGQDDGDQKGDYATWCSVGPWLHWADGGHLTVTVAIGVAPGKYREVNGGKYAQDYNRYMNQALKAVAHDSIDVLRSKYPTLDNALASQVAFEGAYESRAWPVLPDYYGREYCVKAPAGTFFTLSGCPDHDSRGSVVVTDKRYECFDMDCDYCTGAFSKSRNTGLFHRTWLAEAPPPSPALNTSIAYNYTDNPDRKYAPTGDRKITLAWDNTSETTPDPKSGQFDFRGYKIWKVSNWTRPVGSGGPAEDDWTLLAEFRYFDQAETNGLTCPPESLAAGVCENGLMGPYVFVPQTGGYKHLLLHRGDLWDRQSGAVVRPDSSVLCKGYPNCESEQAFALGQTGGAKVVHFKYPIGRYRYVDTDVKDGFTYFYSVTAFDSTGSGDNVSLLESRRTAVEAEGVTPQYSTDAKDGPGGVWVVPNPYRGVRQIKDRPSAWDLTPNASDPTGTHVDFLGLPRGDWKIKVFTVSGDLVVEIGAHDGVNQSIRSTATDNEGRQHEGYNRQQDTPNDGQARWNLISRNGQDVVSGIYLFTVEVGGTTKQRGKFVIIR